MEVTSDSCWRSFDRHSLLAVLFVIVLPLFLNHSLWFEVLGGIRPQAWDGSGHYALAQIYNHSIFPETFGWTNAYFAGLGFPNFYPPLFYFLVALLAHTHLVSLAVAFKIVLVLPMLLLPAAVWWLAYRLGGRHRIAATCAALALMPLLIDYRFTNSSGVIGLSHTSTFLLGLYTQPLGFVLLMVWYVIYVECGNSLPFSKAATSRRPPKYFVLSSILLALALLANFFSSNVAALMVITVVAYDLFKRDRGFIAHLAIPVVALCLMLFWLAPLISSYRFVVTRPVRTPLAELLLPVMWPWYALAALGGWLWVRRTREGAHVPFLLMCALLFLAICLGGTIAPRWFPFQPNRLVATLNFMLAVPVGQAIAAGLRALGIVGKGQGGKSREEGAKGKRRAFGRATKSVNMRPLRLYVTLGAAVILLFAFIEPSQSQWAFYDAKEWERIAPVLRFAEQHRDGRYLVENLPFSDLDAAHDGRAINAYLGAQGNEVLSLFFREGAPNVLFLNPLADSLSAQADSYGISSTLVDDSDYFNQSVRQHIEQAKLFGVKYLVMHSPSTKAKLGSVSGVTRYELGQWSVFDLGGAATPTVSTLAYQPALVVSDFSLKLRRRDGYDFMRFAEEQFADNSYDVLLARSPERKIDRLGALDNFGALIIDTYDSDDEAFAFERLREFAQNGLLILLSSDSLLFRRIQSSLAEFPRAEIIERHAGSNQKLWRK